MLDRLIENLFGASRLPALDYQKSVEVNDKIVRATYKFSPRIEHNIAFCDVSGDTNFLHRPHPKSKEKGYPDYYKQAFSPLFMQFTESIMLMRKTLKDENLAQEFRNINFADYPFSVNESIMSEAPVLTSRDYEIVVEISCENRVLISSANVLNENRASGAVALYTLNRTAYMEKPNNFLPGVQGESINEIEFNGNPSKFGKIFNSSSEGNLLKIAASSSSVCEALEKGRLSIGNVMPAYAGTHTVYSQAPKTPDLREGLRLYLYMQEPGRFGKETGKKDNPVDLAIVGKTGDETAYVIKSSLRFLDLAFWEIALKRGLRKQQ